MPAPFERTSFSWQVQQLRQQVEEWLELTLSNSPEPNFSLSIWLPKITFWLILGLISGWLVWQLFKRIKSYLRFRQQTEKLVNRPAQGQAVELAVAEWLRRSQSW